MAAMSKRSKTLRWTASILLVLMREALPRCLTHAWVGRPGIVPAIRAVQYSSFRWCPRYFSSAFASAVARSGGDGFEIRSEVGNRCLSVAQEDELDCDDDNGARSLFGTREYWDDLYQGRGDFPADEYQWYFGWENYGKHFRQYVPNKDSVIMIPGIGNDPVILDLLQSRYSKLVATDYSEHAIERQHDLLSYEGQLSLENVELLQMDARKMPLDWENKFDAILEKGALDAIYLSGDGNLELTVKEFERTLKPGGILVSVSGVVPADLRREFFKDWEWFRDGSDDMQAGCFILGRTKNI